MAQGKYGELKHYFPWPHMTNGKLSAAKTRLMYSGLYSMFISISMLTYQLQTIKIGCQSQQHSFSQDLRYRLIFFSLGSCCYSITADITASYIQCPCDLFLLLYRFSQISASKLLFFLLQLSAQLKFQCFFFLCYALITVQTYIFKNTIL